MAHVCEKIGLYAAGHLGCILGLLQPDSGSIRIGGEEIIGLKGGGGVAELLVDVRHGEGHHLPVEPQLVAEVVVHRREVGTRLAAQIAHGHRLEASLGEEPRAEVTIRAVAERCSGHIAETSSPK